MSEKKKREVRINVNSPVVTVNKETNEAPIKTETQPEKQTTKIKRPPPVFPKLLPYTPPDSLMFPLFSAIQRKAWVRARKLCYDLILCDPLRQNYRDLYYQIDHILTLIDHRRRPRAVLSKSPTPVANTRSSSSSSSSDDEE